MSAWRLFIASACFAWVLTILYDLNAIGSGVVAALIYVGLTALTFKWDDHAA